MSVIIPCYNQAHYLKDCLTSLQAQTHQVWEAIVVDDASTAEDPELIVARLRDARCRVIRHQTNRGLAAARNTGFRVAQAALVLPLDADDCLGPTFLEETVAVLNEHQGVDCVFTDMQRFGTREGVLRLSVGPLAGMLAGHWYIPGSGTLMRRQVWTDVGGYAELDVLRAGSEDRDFGIAAMQLGIRVMHIPLPLYMYRQHPQSLCATVTPYYEYLTRDATYERHRELFDRLELGPRFRSDGYLTSAAISWARGEHWRALNLALKGIRLDPRNPRLARRPLKAIWPTALTPSESPAGPSRRWRGDETDLW